MTRHDASKRVRAALIEHHCRDIAPLVADLEVACLNEVYKERIAERERCATVLLKRADGLVQRAHVDYLVKIIREGK